MNCNDFFNFFEKKGGKIICNYQSKQCLIQHTNIKCTINNKTDSEKLDWLIWKNYKNVSSIKNNGLEIKNNIHRYQNNDDKGIIIESLK